MTEKELLIKLIVSKCRIELAIENLEKEEYVNIENMSEFIDNVGTDLKIIAEELKKENEND